MKNKPAPLGFSLIELMVVVAVIGILAAIAIPSYQDSVRKGKRAEGRTALTDFMLQQERYMTQMNSYTTFAAGATTGTATSFKTYSGDTRGNAAYLLGAETCDAPNNDIKLCVRVFAEPQFTDTDAGTLQVLSTSTKTCTGTKTSVCWK
jgi:type IV pilus assembly protein PilE